MKYIQCPTEANPHSLKPTLFLAGGISICPDWQTELIAKLKHTNWTILNPRRTDFDVENSRLAAVFAANALPDYVVRIGRVEHDEQTAFCWC